MSEGERRKRKGRVRKRASPKREAAPAERSLEGVGRLWVLLPSLVMFGLSLVPAIASRGRVQISVWLAAGLAGVLAAGLLRRPGAFRVSFAPRRPHYMQALTQLGVFIWWGTYWEPVAGFAGLIAVQILFAYQVDLLLTWWRGRSFCGGFGQLPIIGSINLFLWFKDDHFHWQLALVALCYVGKELVSWERGGRRRHIFNPSSFGLAVASALLLLSASTELTWAREIAVTQEDTPHMWKALFAVGLIVQLQFPVVLVTMSAAITTWVLGLAFTQVTGVYVFATTDIPAAVLLGMLLLITDPATSPSGRTAQVLFGATYGAMVVVLFLLLESWGGSFGYFDKLLPVPILNLLVRRFDDWGARLRASLSGFGQWSQRNLIHVGAWGLLFAVLLLTEAVGAAHPGRDITFWLQACEQQRFLGCKTYFDLLANSCRTGEMRACHNLGVELGGLDAIKVFRRACDGGLPESCAELAKLRQKAAATAGSDHPLAEACNSGDMNACYNFADALAHGRGVASDPMRAAKLYQLACNAGLTQACNSLAALAMQGGAGIDKAQAESAFRTSCDADDYAGCVNLALMYLRGDGVERDPAKAASLNQRACDGGLGIGCARLADAYQRGEGVEADAVRAAGLRVLACKRGHAPACQ
jgi:TPR repeat protein